MNVLTKMSAEYVIKKVDIDHKVVYAHNAPMTAKHVKKGIQQNAIHAKILLNACTILNVIQQPQIICIKVMFQTVIVKNA